MHYLVKLLVQADNSKAALDRALDDAETLIEWGNFDWYNTDGRWGKTKAYKATSAKGKELLESGIEQNKIEIEEALKGIKYILDNYTPDEIVNEEYGHPSQYQDKLPEGVYHLSNWHFSRMDAKTGPYVYAVDGNIWGGKVNNQRELDKCLSGKDNLWVVPIDFHN